MFIIPRMFWKLWNDHTGLSITNVLAMAERSTVGPANEIEDQMNALKVHIQRWIDFRELSLSISQYRSVSKARNFVSKIGLHHGNFLAFLYLLTDALYTINSIGQFFLLDSVLAINFRYIGPDFLASLSDSKPWLDEARFPRVAYCDFDIRQLTNLQRWTVQCTLPINLFNEKIFIFVWFLLIIISIINLAHFLYNLTILFIPYTKFQYISKYMVITHSKGYMKDQKVRASVERFVHEYMKNDGVFIIWMITQNSSASVASDVIENLWHDYKEKKVIEGDEEEGVEEAVE